MKEIHLKNKTAKDSTKKASVTILFRGENCLLMLRVYRYIDLKTG